MAMVFMFIRVSLILDFFKLYVVLRVWIEGLCVVPLAPAEDALSTDNTRGLKMVSHYKEASVQLSTNRILYLLQSNILI
jgi:hypothetical protein